MSAISYTRALLSLWSRWGRVRVLGYPRSSAFVPKPQGGHNEAPPEVVMVDRVVASLGNDPDDRQHQRVLRYHYLSDGSVRQRIKGAKVSSRTYYRWLDEAQWAVHVRLTRIE